MSLTIELRTRWVWQGKARTTCIHNCLHGVSGGKHSQIVPVRLGDRIARAYGVKHFESFLA